MMPVCPKVGYRFASGSGGTQVSEKPADEKNNFENHFPGEAQTLAVCSAHVMFA